MKSQPSFQCHVKTDTTLNTVSKSCSTNITNVVSRLSTNDVIDLTKEHGERRTDRKSSKILRRTDMVYFVDLLVSCDYDEYFLGTSIDPKIKLNTSNVCASMGMNEERFRTENEEMIKKSEEVTPPLKSDSSSGSSNTKDEWDLLGLKAYKIANITKRVSNILTQAPTKPIDIADFDGDRKAHLPYNT